MVRRGSEEGIALLLVLWVMMILMVIVLSFSFMTRTESQATLSFKEGIEKRFLAEAGIERGIMELFYRNQYKNQTIILEGSEVWTVDGTPHQGQIGDGSYSVRITDDSGKIDLNKLSDANAIIMKTLLMNLGVSEEQANIIADSILDWKDSGDMDAHHEHGVESEYYKTLPNPYEAKNANFDSVEELLLVKGVTPEILYGTAEGKGLTDFITVGSEGRGQKMTTVPALQININAAPREVLTAVPGMTSEIVENIISLRATKDITPQEVGVPGTAIPGGNFVVSSNGPYTIEAVGYKTEEKKGYAIKATVAFVVEGQRKFRYLYYKSPAKVPSSGEQKE